MGRKGNNLLIMLRAVRWVGVGWGLSLVIAVSDFADPSSVHSQEPACPLLTSMLAKSRCQTEKMAPSSREWATTSSLHQFPYVDSPTLTALTTTAKEKEGGREIKTGAMKSYGLLVWLHLIDADLSPKRYWQRPKSQVNG